MGATERVLRQIRNHLTGLSVSQRVALGLCVVIIAGSTVWLLQWSGRKTAIPLLDQDFSSDELASAQSQLGDMGVDHKVVGSRIHVYATASERRQILAKLVRRGGLPKNTEVGFQEILSETSVLASNSEREKLWTLALSNELSMTFGLIEGVAKAQVFIDKRQKRRFRGPSIVPTASVSLWMRGGSVVDRKLAYAVASAVSGAVSGLEPWNVRVMDMVAGRVIPIPDPSKGISMDMLEKRQESDRYFEERIKRQLGYIPGIRVAVFSVLNTEKRTEKEIKGEEVFKRKEESKDLGQRPGTTGQKPGVVANQKTITRQSILGSLTRITASIGVPRRYLVMVYRQENPEGEEGPQDQALEPVKTKIFDDIRKQIGNIINAEDPETQVAVNMVYEIADPVAAMPAQVAGVEEGLLGVARQYGAEAGLGALGLVSLLMMVMVVRRASGGVEIPSERREAMSKEDLKGVDEGLLRTQQLVDQVSQMIRSEPEVAVDLVKKWVERGT